MKSIFETAKNYAAKEWMAVASVEVAADFGNTAVEFRAARERIGLVDRSDRALLRVTGRARQAWLHNVVTNDVKSLTDGQSCYAFACDVRGRVQFDLHVLVIGDEIWLDVAADRRNAIAQYLDRYIISEDARIAPVDGFARIGIVCGGGKVGFQTLPGAESGQMSSMSHKAVELSLESAGGAAAGRIWRHDFAGGKCFELLVPAAVASAVWDFLVECDGAVPVGFAALDALRIDAGIPWYGRDIDDNVIAPETGQIERAISYRKGCYLGQEIIERMRSLGTPARRLVQVQMSDGAPVALPAKLCKGGADAGRITSLVRHPLAPERIGLGYVRTSIKDPVGITTQAGDFEVVIQK